MATDDDLNQLPERTIYRMLTTAVAGITADTSLLRRILGNLEDATEEGKAEAIWADHPPKVVQGYPRASAQLPCYAIVLTGEPTSQDYIGLGDHAWLADDDADLGNLFHARVTGVFTIYVYTQSVDLCLWYYRILRRIVRVGSKYLIDNGLEEPKLDGADLMPDPQYTPENVYVRKLTLTVEYQETWTDQDDLWDALVGAGYPANMTPATISEVEVKHEDQPDGGVHPYSDSE